jgi:hypothetical protein
VVVTVYFELGNERPNDNLNSSPRSHHFIQDAEVVLKHPVSLNVCHHNFVHSFVTESFVRYINGISFHFFIFKHYEFYY